MNNTRVKDHKWLKPEKKIALVLEDSEAEEGDNIKFVDDGTSYKIFVMRTLYDEKDDNSVIGMVAERKQDSLVDEIKNIF